KLGGGQLAAPPWFGDTSAPAICGCFAGFGTGCPFSSYPVDQFVLTYSDEMMAVPLVRSSTKKCPLRAAWATSLRVCPLTWPSKSTAVCVESQSCVSCGDDWKYQFIFPVSGLSDTIDAVNRFAPARFTCAMTGCGLPVVTYIWFSSGS